MDAGHWGEAQKLLGQVQDKEPGFLETERLLSKVETEIRQSEEEQKRQDQINTLYEQAHGLLRSKKWRQALDKIEEIRKLDEQFEDPEKIAERAQVELAREEQEAERQNELAAMYAEAVRLLREEKYQEALEKWQEIKSIDAKYPDRQKVQRTARKSLAALAKPVTGKAQNYRTKIALDRIGWYCHHCCHHFSLNLIWEQWREAIITRNFSSYICFRWKGCYSDCNQNPCEDKYTSRPTATQVDKRLC